MHVGDDDGGVGDSDGGSSQCGPVVCGAGLECCNASCGICAPPGVACPAIACADECTTNADCAGGEYCQLDEGACGGVGVCTPRPSACDELYDPVCGCDGVTHSNRCSAAGAGVSVASVGECGTDPVCAPLDARGEGACDAIVGVTWDGTRCLEISGCSCVGSDCGRYGAGGLERCQREYASCGTCAAQDAEGVGDCRALLGYRWDGDGCSSIGGCECAGADCDRLYMDESSCLADFAHCVPGPACARNADCERGSYCHLEPGQCLAGDGGTGFGECRSRVTDVFCTDDGPPICGCDGRTYACEFEANQAGTSVAYDGACDGGPCSPQIARGIGPCFLDLGVAWNGTECVSVGGCTCEGPDCDSLYRSHAECRAARTGCGPEMRPCGGFAGLVCDPDEWCDYPDGSFCGGTDETGVCRPRPDTCPPVIDEVCGCDGVLYTSACDANASGYDTFGGAPGPSGCGAPPPMP